MLHTDLFETYYEIKYTLIFHISLFEPFHKKKPCGSRYHYVQSLIENNFTKGVLDFKLIVVT
nr:hypothetical protein [Escherichia coli]